MLRNLFGKLEQHVVVVENGGKAAIDDLGRHRSVGQQQASAKVLVLAGF